MDVTPQGLGPEKLAGVEWRISTYSPNGGANCVEAGPLNDGTGRVALRHGHHPNGTTIAYTAGEFDF